MHDRIIAPAPAYKHFHETAKGRTSSSDVRPFAISLGELELIRIQVAPTSWSAVMWASGPHTDSGGVDAARTAGLETGATRMRYLWISSQLLMTNVKVVVPVIVDVAESCPVTVTV